MPPIAFHLSMLLALIESLGLAGFLLWRARRVDGVGYLVLFLSGVAVWVASCELPSWCGVAAVPLGVRLVGFSSLTSAFFLHFILVFCRLPRASGAIFSAYLAGGLATLAAMVIPAGRYEPWAGLDYFFVPNGMGWAVGAVWAALAIAGHAVMFLSWLNRTGPPRRQLVAMCLASGWGLLCMAGYAFRPLGIDLYPYPLLLLPAYPVILVYGILRYQLMVVNAWARRALAWILLVGLGSAVIVGLAALPFPLRAPSSGWRLGVIAVATLLLPGLLLDPLRRLATRIVYPGSRLSEDSIGHWRTELRASQSFAELEAAAIREISGQLRTSITVTVCPGTGASPDGEDGPRLVCTRAAGDWQTELVGWEAAPPGPRHVAQLFGAVLADSAERVEQVIASADRERERQKQERLAELGALAATVAHDIRNPLNIIAMAATAAPPEARREIALQTSRISQLATDLLDYAKSWRIEATRLDLVDLIRTSTRRFPEIEFETMLPEALAVDGDPRRLGQVLVNLFDNARAAVAGAAGRIGVHAGRRPDGMIEIHVCDNGSGVPDEIRETLFQPFVSRSANGTGLGLAIVAKIMAAHGGTVAVTRRPGWTTCFTLGFPAPEGS